jgi:hypothetical protein
VNVSSIFVTGNTVAVGDADAVGDGDGEGVDVGDGVRVGAGVTLSRNAEDVGDDCTAGEISFCGDVALLGVADVAAFDGVGVGDLRAPDGELFDFGVGVGVGLGIGVCSLRSTPM